jgi:hypothetical protein
MQFALDKRRRTLYSQIYVQQRMHGRCWLNNIDAKEMPADLAIILAQVLNLRSKAPISVLED